MTVRAAVFRDHGDPSGGLGEVTIAITVFMCCTCSRCASLLCMTCHAPTLNMPSTHPPIHPPIHAVVMVRCATLRSAAQKVVKRTTAKVPRESALLEWTLYATRVHISQFSVFSFQFLVFSFQFLVFGCWLLVSVWRKESKESGWVGGWVRGRRKQKLETGQWERTVQSVQQASCSVCRHSRRHPLQARTHALTALTHSLSSFVS